MFGLDIIVLGMACQPRVSSVQCPTSSTSALCKRSPGSSICLVPPWPIIGSSDAPSTLHLQRERATGHITWEHHQAPKPRRNLRRTQSIIINQPSHTTSIQQHHFHRPTWITVATPSEAPPTPASTSDRRTPPLKKRAKALPRCDGPAGPDDEEKRLEQYTCSGERVRGGVVCGGRGAAACGLRRGVPGVGPRLFKNRIRLRGRQRRRRMVYR